MKYCFKINLLLLFSVMAFRATAQTKAVVSEALNQHKATLQSRLAEDAVKGSLTTTDAVQTNAQKQTRYFDRYTIDVQEGQVLAFEMESTAFRVMTGLQSPDGKTSFGFDPATPFEEYSFHRFVVNVPKSGTYQLLVTSADAEKTGTYTVRKTILTSATASYAPDSPLAQRLQQLIALRKLDFKPIMGAVSREFENGGYQKKAYQTSFLLDNRATAEIVVNQETKAHFYLSTLFGEFPDEAAAIEKLQEVWGEIKPLVEKYNWLQQTEETKYAASSAEDYIEFRVEGRKLLFEYY